MGMSTEYKSAGRGTTKASSIATFLRLSAHGLGSFRETPGQTSILSRCYSATLAAGPEPCHQLQLFSLPLTTCLFPASSLCSSLPAKDRTRGRIIVLWWNKWLGQGTNGLKKLSFSQAEHRERGSSLLVVFFNLILPVTNTSVENHPWKNIQGDAIQKPRHVRDSASDLLPSQPWAKCQSTVRQDIALNLGRSVFSEVGQRWSQNVLDFMSFCSKNISSLTPGYSRH